MSQYVYRVAFVAHRDLEGALNEKADAGWDVETIIPAVEWGMCVVVFYREREPDAG